MPIFVVVGRTNVGKSTFFNAISKEKLRAIACDFSCTTRDCNYAIAGIGDLEFVVVDTPGITGEKDAPEQLIDVLHECDVIGFMVDGKEGVSGSDFETVKFLKRLESP